MKLIAFAYGGGDGHVYYPMKKDLQKLDIELIPYSYKGRNARLGESNYNSIEEVATEAALFIKENDTGEDFALIGHSMGSLVAYECYYKLLEIDYHIPKTIIFSGLLPPHRLIQNKYTLDDDEKFIEELSLLGGLQKEILENKEFLDYFLGIMKNDIIIFDKYEFIEKESKIKSDTVILTGSEDAPKGDNVIPWSDLTNDSPKFVELKGNHFFLFKEGLNYMNLFSEIIK